MNKDLKNTEYNIPENIINYLKHHIAQNDNNNSGVKRAKKLIEDGKVNYNQLKRILHDIENCKNDITKYNLYGGKLMEDWGWKMLGDDRYLIQSRKKSKEKSRNITGLGKNAFNKSHRKKPTFTSPSNIFKSNSDTKSFSSILPSTKLFEEINRIKKIMY